MGTSGETTSQVAWDAQTKAKHEAEQKLETNRYVRLLEGSDWYRPVLDYLGVISDILGPLLEGAILGRIEVSVVM